MLDTFKEFKLESDWAGVKRAYLEQLKVWHPDRFGSDEELRKKCEERTKELNQAFLALKTHLADLEKNGVNVEWDKPILPQLVSSGLLKEQKLSFEQEPIKYEQEPLVERKLKAENRVSEEILEENIWHPQLIAAGIVSFVALIFASYFLVVHYLESKKPKIVYGPPADLSKYAKNKNLPTDTFKEEFEKSVNVEQSKAGDSVIEGQMSSVRIISGVQKDEPEDIPQIIKYASRCDVEGVKKELAKGKGVNSEDSAGMSSLSWAAKNNCEALAKLLISKGANINHMSTNGFTPLAWAKWHKNIEVLRVLELDQRNIVVKR